MEIPLNLLVIGDQRVLKKHLISDFNGKLFDVIRISISV